MKHLSFLQLFGDTYNCGTYGSGDYNQNECSTSVDGGPLADTGTNVVVGVGAGLILVAVAVFVLIRGRKNKK
ncbi:MAG TPA: LPXTG cell wall anchor domain-containing protein [Candidatus Saccharibacteria bacterium]|nr:LPXTG cell wall anchor domain-containing protein [Candidatus Saccharibacteria bacterium]